jgi:hypothetical protein
VDDQYTVFLIGGGDEEKIIFTLIDNGDDCRLRCQYRDNTIESSAPDYFQALCDVRARLANDGLVPFCYGASLNVYPSGMARDMGQGLKAYKLTMGKQAQMVDLVEIFTEGPHVVPSSVEMQEQFFRNWIAALGP